MRYSLGDNDKPEHLSGKRSSAPLDEARIELRYLVAYIKNSKNKKPVIFERMQKKKGKNSENTADGCIQDEQSWKVLQGTES